MIPATAALRLAGLTKTYLGATRPAVEDVTLSINAGEIHAVIGENGAGKTTLMNLAVGIVAADQGTIHAPSAGRIAMVHQHHRFDRTMTLWENIALEPPNALAAVPVRSRRLWPRSAWITALHEQVRRFGRPIDLVKPVGRMAAAEAQRAAVFVGWLRSPQLFVLDEPTAVWGPADTTWLFALLRDMKANGCAVVLVTHRLQEVMMVADRTSVLRNGRLVATVERESLLSTHQLSELMLGAPPTPSAAITRPTPSADAPGVGAAALRPVVAADPALVVSNLGYVDDWGHSVDAVSLVAYPGEILGVTGIRENGLDLLEALITGMVRPKSGTIRIHGRPARRFDTYEFRKMGMDYVPSDRRSVGSVAQAGVADNLVAVEVARGASRVARAGFFVSRLKKQLVDRLLASVDLSLPHDTPAGILSGGMLQRLILARELADALDKPIGAAPARRRLIIVSEPSWGLDVKARATAHRQIGAAKAAGASVVVISVDIDEVVALCDRCYVMYAGRIAGEFAATAETRDLIGEAMLGVED